MQLFSKTLHRKILTLILFVSIVPALAGILQVYWGSIIAINSVIGEYCENQTSRLAQEIGNMIEEKSKALIAMKDETDFLFLLEGSIDFQSKEFGKKNVSTALVKSLTQDTTLKDDTIILTTQKGEILASSDPDIKIDFSREIWWNNMLQASADKFYFAEIFTKGDDKIRLAIATPVYLYNSEDALGMLVCLINKRSIFSKIESLQTGEGIFFTLHSSNNIFIYEHPENTMLTPILDENIIVLSKKLVGHFAPKKIEQGKNLVAFSYIKQIKMWYKEGKSNCDWVVISKFETSRIITFVNMLLWRICIFGGAVVIVICILGLVLSNRIVRPLKDLRNAALKLADGELDTYVSIKTNDELEILAETFNEMTESLRITYDDLANKILEIDEKARQIELIHEITKAINAALDLEQIFIILSKEINKVVFYDRLAIAFIEEEDGKKKIRFDFVAPNTGLIHYPGQKLPIEQTKYSLSLETKKPIVIHDLEKEKLQPMDEHLLEENIHSCLIIPILAQSAPIGFFSLASKTPNTYAEKDVELLTKISEALGVAVEHSRLYQRISKFAEELEEKIRERTRELERAQFKLVQTEKLAATGKLAANLAHEINNPLGIIKNYIRMISDVIKVKTELTDATGTPIMENFNVVKEELDRIARIVKNLLNVYKTPDMQSVMVDINHEIEQLINLMKNGFVKKKITVDLKLDNSLPNIMAPQDALRQIILNLFRNAEDAMESGGMLTVKTYMTTVSGLKGALKYICLEVKDTGCGIPHHHLGKIFDPFFTTKKEKGTGLGLSVTYGLVESFGGTIEVDSTLRKGTVFKITIPMENPINNA